MVNSAFKVVVAAGETNKEVYLELQKWKRCAAP
ncbi:hypothetical protein A8990_102149 [Paenibacillus taihuensis]|uniref:Uncharacterized protein n=1 Tax=Paenibacillus taihuensis TaxID=1156355 RepID=A0A3D9SJK9_9BACL|nr:hypothetical protein A8990_102149 [Paenibacillus taihuensis]